MSEQSEKSELRKLVEANQLEREESAFKKRVIDRLDQLDARLEKIDMRSQDFASREQLDQVAGSLRQHLVWVLILVVGSAIAMWKMQNA